MLNVGLNEKKFGGSKLNFTAKLSYNPRIDLTYTYSRPSLANFNLSYNYRNEHFPSVIDVDKSINLRYWHNTVSGFISQFHLLNISTNVGLSYQSVVFERKLNGISHSVHQERNAFVFYSV